MKLNDLVMKAYAAAEAKGFRDASPLEDMALIHSEVSEAVEDLRAPEVRWSGTREDGKPIGVASEIADIMIRCAHFCGKHGIDLEAEVLRKLAYNETRPHKHGKRI